MQNPKVEINQEFRRSLQEEFSRRIRNNERYSIRSFAVHLGIDSSSLSQILAGKRAVSETKINELCRRVGLPIPGKSKSLTPIEKLSLDQFAVISDWYHFAILDLTLLKTFRNDVNWMAKKLSIQPLEVLGAIERMKRLGLLVEKNGKLKKAKDFYTNYSEGTTSAALKEYQRQMIRKALRAVDDCPQDRKDITSMTIAADSRRLKEAKVMIKNFRRELCSFLEGGEGDSVYHLALQLYPVTNTED